VDTLPDTFGTLLVIIEECRRHKINFEKAAESVDGLAEWTTSPLTKQEWYKPQTIRNEGLKDGFVSFLELYKICEKSNPGFTKKIEELAGKFEHMKCESHPAPIKKKTRAIYKFIYKYGYDATRLTDVMRASFIFYDLQSIREAAKIINDHFKNEGGVANIKDRIATPPSSGYRDVLINVKVGSVYAEIQLHLKAFYDLKSDMHTNYKKARHFGKDFEKICFGTE